MRRPSRHHRFQRDRPGIDRRQGRRMGPSKRYFRLNGLGGGLSFDDWGRAVQYPQNLCIEAARVFDEAEMRPSHGALISIGLEYGYRPAEDLGSRRVFGGGAAVPY